MIKIITIDRESGSGAAEIAATLAARLRWKLSDELLTIEIARILGCDCPAVEEREERRDTLHYRLFKAFLRGSFEGTLNAQRVKMVDADCIRQASEKVVREAAGQGNCVIVGGSEQMLQETRVAKPSFWRCAGVDAKHPVSPLFGWRLKPSSTLRLEHRRR
jgi:Cytidylate kinase-like family